MVHPMYLSSLIKEFKAGKSAIFIKTIENVLCLLQKETGKIGNLTITESLVTLKPTGEALVIGDLHGNVDSLLCILQNSKFIQKLANCKNATLIFLGDYGDRGAHSAEVYYIILKLKLAFPDQVVLLRGNHEGPKDLMASPHDLPIQFQAVFKENWAVAYSKIRELFDCLYTAVLVEELCLMVHGGLSQTISSSQDLAQALRTHPVKEFLEDLLWSDPVDMAIDILNSPRGAGNLFGKRVTEKVLNELGCKILIRGHEPCEDGFKFNHDDKVLTLFSTKGAPYFNTYSAYLQFPLSGKFWNAQQLFPYIHRL